MFNKDFNQTILEKKGVMDVMVLTRPLSFFCLRFCSLCKYELRSAPYESKKKEKKTTNQG